MPNLRHCNLPFYVRDGLNLHSPTCVHCPLVPEHREPPLPSFPGLFSSISLSLPSLSIFFLSLFPSLMATIAGVSPTTSAANLHRAIRRLLQEFDPEKSLQSEEEELYQADDDDSESHEYQPVHGSIRVLRALFCRKNNSNVKGARISRQMWRKGVILFLFFALAIFGAPVSYTHLTLPTIYSV